jgi:hypothetical protein
VWSASCSPDSWLGGDPDLVWSKCMIFQHPSRDARPMVVARLTIPPAILK